MAWILNMRGNFISIFEISEKHFYLECRRMVAVKGLVEHKSHNWVIEMSSASNNHWWSLYLQLSESGAPLSP